MVITKKEAFRFIYRAKKSAAKFKMLMFCCNVPTVDLEYVMHRYRIYDEAVTFFNALYYWLKDGIISPENAFNEAFERHQKMMKSAA